MTGGERLIDLRDLKVWRANTLELDIASLTLDAGSSLLVLGEASSGKDGLCRVLGNFAEDGEEWDGTIQFRNGAARSLRRRVRPTVRTTYLAGPRVAPLNPFASVQSQLAEVVARKLNVPIGSAAEDLRIALARFPSAPSFSLLRKKPRDLNDLQLAWSLLACAIAQTPDLLIADHTFSDLSPSSAQALAGALIGEQKRLGFALVYFADGLQIATHLRCRTIVLRRGKVIEEGDFEKLASGQSHAYTQTLFKAVPQIQMASAKRSIVRGEPLLQVFGLDLSSDRKKPSSGRDGLNLELRRGASLAIVGEDGSGRRKLVRAMLGLDRVPNGKVVLDQVDLSILSPAMTSRLRRRIAFIAGADDALDPRMTLWDTVDEPLRAHLRLPRDLTAGYRETALKRVGLASHDGKRAVATLSPFDNRRLQVARTIVSAPFLVVVDEPLHGLDAFAQSVMLDLLKELRKQEGPAFLVVTADMRVAEVLADDVLIIRQGEIVERGSVADVVRAPKADETRKLLNAVMSPPFALHVGDSLPTRGNDRADRVPAEVLNLATNSIESEPQAKPAPDTATERSG